MSEPSVSIILPCHNRAPVLARSIESVLRQTFGSFELLVIDDASSDESRSITLSFRDDRVRYWRLDVRRGAGGARNEGINRATARFIAFQDSDDEWLPEKLQNQLHELNKCPNVGVCYSDMIRILKNGSTVDFPAPDITDGTIIDSSNGRYFVQNIGIQSCLVRRSVLLSVGLFIESLPAFEDLELLIRLAQVTQFRRIAKPLVRYYESEGISSNLSNLARARRMLIEIHAAEWMKHRRLLVSELAHIGGIEQLVLEQALALSAKTT